jgi:hypothetical protein
MKNEQRRIVAYLDGLPPSLRFGDLRQAKVNALRELQVKGGEELSPPLHFGDGSRSALMPSVLDRVFEGEL